MKLVVSFLIVLAMTATLRAAEDLPAGLPPARDVHEARATTPVSVQNKMLGPNVLTEGELVTVFSANGRPVPIYQGIKTVGYLNVDDKTHTIAEFSRIGGRMWARLDSMQPDTWVTADSLRLVPEVLMGMTRAQVANRIGNPTRVNRTEEGEEWIFEAYQVLVDRQVVEAREEHRSLVPVIDPKGGTLTVWLPQYYETTKRYTVDNPYWAKVLDKRFIFKADKLSEIKDLQQAPVPPRQQPPPGK
jgi:hypothetical protein